MNDKSNDIRAIAFYLPQYHPIPENDKWWGKGFTEWTNTAKAKPLFLNHYQPHIPTDLGFYDLRLPEARYEQAKMAQEYGIEAFCYYHYWFAGKRIIQTPFENVLDSGEPKIPFCLCWANQTWTGVWHGAPNKILIKQTYPGIEDHRKHFTYLLNAFKDKRYITVDGKPLFIIFQPKEIPRIYEVIELWRQMAMSSGLKGIFLVGFSWDDNWNPLEDGFDASISERLHLLQKSESIKKEPLSYIIRIIGKMFGKPTIYQYKDVLTTLIKKDKINMNCIDFPCVIPNWDNTPRCGKSGIVIHKSTPELFREHLRSAISKIKPLKHEKRIIFVKSWNEWAEGNHLEPDMKYGKGYLDVIKEEILNK